MSNEIKRLAGNIEIASAFKEGESFIILICK
jgi:hypothetical protein